MSGSAPIWLTILIAILTGIFTLGGQALGGFQTRKSQAQLFEAQRRASRSDEDRRRLEELYSRFTTMFDQTDDAITSYRNHKKGLLSRELVTESIGKDDNENYKRMKVLLRLYYPELGEAIASCIGSAIVCRNWLLSWKDDASEEQPDDFDRNWAEAVRLERLMAKRMADIASGLG